jgi:hypothetical protein
MTDQELVNAAMAKQPRFNEYCANDDENPIDLDLVDRRMEVEPCIAVVEEFGFFEWIWFPPFPMAELEAKWQGLPACGNAFREALGGDWYEMLDTGNVGSK